MLENLLLVLRKFRFIFCMSVYEKELMETEKMIAIIQEALLEERENLANLEEVLSQNYFALSGASNAPIFNFEEYKNILHSIEKTKEMIIDKNLRIIELNNYEKENTQSLDFFNKKIEEEKAKNSTGKVLNFGKRRNK